MARYSALDLEEIENKLKACITVDDHALFGYYWDHTKAIKILRAALKDVESRVDYED